MIKPLRLIGILFFSGLLSSHLAFSAESFIDFIRTPIEENQKEIIIEALQNGAQTQAMVQYIDGIYHVPFSEDIFEITFYGDNDEIVYISSDGQYIFQSDVIYVPDAVSITRLRREDLAQLKGLVPPPPILEEGFIGDEEEDAIETVLISGETPAQQEDQPQSDEEESPSQTEEIDYSSEVPLLEETLNLLEE